jgi:hypothetical protein
MHEAKEEKAMMAVSDRSRDVCEEGETTMQY